MKLTEAERWRAIERSNLELEDFAKYGRYEDERLVDELYAHLYASKRAAKSALLHARRVGVILIEAKRRHGQHGRWLDWLAKNWSQEESTAQLYMRIAEHWPFLQSRQIRDGVPDLPLSVRDAKRLLAGRRAAIPPGGDDRVMTPSTLAEQVVALFKPRGTILEPCAGDGSFARALKKYGRVRTCEIDNGRNFLEWKTRVTWVGPTNPPWSQFRPFLKHSMTLAPNVVFVAPVVHWWTRRRVNDVREAGFGYRRLVLIDQAPEEWPATGFQLGAMHLRRGYTGPLAIERLDP